MNHLVTISETRVVNINKPVVYVDPLDEFEEKTIYMILEYNDVMQSIKLKPFLIDGKVPSGLIENSINTVSIKDVRNIEIKEFGFDIEFNNDKDAITYFAKILKDENTSN